ncbi:hypothetical protein [Paenibacillus sp. GCM10027626]|uniref:hypothetical protein n=1 Tax=Paenibacillus sp. GCM10027626 TaxID=3273411 RepID=UPI003634D1B2
MHQSRKEQGIERAGKQLLQPERNEALLFASLEEELFLDMNALADGAASSRYQETKGGRS